MGAVYDEDTGETPRCPTCGSEEECDHIVAVIDKTFGECHGGELFGHDQDFFSALEDTFEKLLMDGEEPIFSNDELSMLWEATEFHQSEDSVSVELGSQKWAVLISLLEDAGAAQPYDSLIEEGGPGSTSAMAYLFGDDPAAIVEAAKRILAKRLANCL